MAKIAQAVEDVLARRRIAGRLGSLELKTIAKGDGWTVEDVVCSNGPHDRPFEEQHPHVTIAIVLAGTFQYRGSHANGCETMTSGSLLLGNAGQCFECGHEHGVGDRCLSFRFTPEYFFAIGGGADAWAAKQTFRSLRLPPLRRLSRVIADASATLAGPTAHGWEEIAVRLAAAAIQVDRDVASHRVEISPAAIARVTRALRTIEAQPGDVLTLRRLAREVGLSPFHFLRLFERVTGATPHQYVMRTRLRTAATRLVTAEAKIVDVALDAGFNDVSTFNRAFRSEFGVSPRVYRNSKRPAAIR